MPIGINYIMKKHSYKFTSADSLTDLINAYFKYIEGDYRLEVKSTKKATEQAELAEHKVYDREPEPATLAGLALYLGFNSKHEFDTYERTGKFANLVKQARLRVEAAYEKKLYQQSSGIIFALKSMGWNEKSDNDTTPVDVIKTIKVKIIESGPQPASAEKEVIL